MNSMQYKPYTMIGSRETPEEIMDLMSDLAIALSHEGFTVRSGGANGADKCAEEASFIEIYLPWDGFNSKYHNGFGFINYSTLGLTGEADKLCSIHHQWWANVKKEGVKHLHRRNCHQVLGAGLKSPSLFVVCFAKPDEKRGEGHVQGGTGTAVSLALSRGIKVINLYFDGEVNEVKDWIVSMGVEK